jgi:hypothetical protein
MSDSSRPCLPVSLLALYYSLFLSLFVLRLATSFSLHVMPLSVGVRVVYPSFDPPCLVATAFLLVSVLAQSVIPIWRYPCLCWMNSRYTWIWWACGLLLRCSVCGYEVQRPLGWVFMIKPRSDGVIDCEI